MKTDYKKAQQGIDQAAESAGEAWQREATKFVRRYLLNNATMHVDDLWDAGLPEPTSKRALGHVLRQLSRDGWIQHQTTDEGDIVARPSASSNGQLKAVWKSEIYPKNHD